MYYSFIIAFLVGIILNTAFAPIGKKIGFLKSHGDAQHKVSKLGGIAIFGSFLAAVILTAARQGQLNMPAAILFLLASMFLLGLIDDIFNLSASAKLIIQSILALSLFACGVRTQIIFLPVWANVILTLFWLVAITNAFNLLDILDGLAAGIAAVGYLTFWYMAKVTGNTTIGILAAGLLGSNLAFLKFNFFPAKLYMGDSGSLFNGFCLATIAVLISYAPAGRETALFAPLLILALPLYDLIFVVAMRWWARRPVTQKSKDHFALRLVAGGLNAQRAVWFMYALNCLFSLAAVLLLKFSNLWGMVILVIAFLAWLFIAYKISRIKIIHEA